MKIVSIILNKGGKSLLYFQISWLGNKILTYDKLVSDFLFLCDYCRQDLQRFILLLRGGVMCYEYITS